jgi:hypothetical protein
MQLVAGSVAVHTTMLAEVKVTVPWASAGRPDTDSVTDEPVVTCDGETVTVIDVFDLVTVNWAPVAVVAL